CAMYLEKPFRIVPEDEVDNAIEAEDPRGVSKVFLCDGDAMALPTPRLLRVLRKVSSHFPDFRRAGIYCWPPNVRRKSDSELRALREAKLGIAYVGLESGDDVTLDRVRKGAKADEFVSCVRRLQEAGIKASVICLLGVGGRDRSREHARATADVLNRMQPKFASFLTVTACEGTPLASSIEKGSFEEVSPMESLQELRWIVEDLEFKGTIVRANHASSYLPIGGTFPKDKEAVLEALDLALGGEISLKPEWMRGL
ncbi:MAG: radical SAM protein, partial [Planctomycetota bacterium]